MATLITGRTSIFTGISIEDYLPNEKIVVSTASPSGRRFHSARITYTDILPGAEAFDSLFDIHDFDNVIFISDLLAPLSQNSLSESLIHYSCAFQSSHLSNPPIFQTFSNLTLDKSSKICGRFAAN